MLDLDNQLTSYHRKSNGLPHFARNEDKNFQPKMDINVKLTIEPPKTQSKCTKKAPEGANFKNGGNDEARTRDLMRDRHAL